MRSRTAWSVVWKRIRWSVKSAKATYFSINSGVLRIVDVSTQPIALRWRHMSVMSEITTTRPFVQQFVPANMKENMKVLLAPYQRNDYQKQYQHLVTYLSSCSEQSSNMNWLKGSSKYFFYIKGNIDEGDSTWWRHQMETFFALLAVCAGTSPHKGQRRGALMFSLICAWINSWINNREAGDLRRHRAHYDATVMMKPCWWNRNVPGKHDQYDYCWCLGSLLAGY